MILVKAQGEIMQTLYIDVYFLINFTVDLLSLHMASKFSKIPTSGKRLIIASVIGGAYAVAIVFLPRNIVFFSALSVLSLFIITYVCSMGCKAFRKIKFMCAFLMFQILIGGFVYFFFGVLERNLAGSFVEENGTNRNLLILALVVLLSMGVLKLLISLFANTFSERNVKLKIVLFEKEYEIDGLVDSGNLLRDPMDGCPVGLIKASFAKRIFPNGIPDAHNTDSISDEIRKKLRIIPINSSGGGKILCAIKPDSVMVIKANRTEKINITIAFDNEGGSFGGYDALVPLSALENV